MEQNLFDKRDEYTVEVDNVDILHSMWHGVEFVYGITSFITIKVIISLWNYDIILSEVVTVLYEV